MVLMTPQLAKIVWNGARTTGNPVYPQGGSSLFKSANTLFGLVGWSLNRLSVTVKYL